MKLSIKVQKTSMIDISILRLSKPEDKITPYLSVSMRTDLAKYLANLVRKDQESSIEKLSQGGKILGDTYTDTETLHDVWAGRSTPDISAALLRPIDTAPRDGTYILVARDSGYSTTSLRFAACPS